ncbi:MAG: rRNA maturation RNase YbeY [Phycisphaerae bacterium]
MRRKPRSAARRSDRRAERGPRADGGRNSPLRTRAPSKRLAIAVAWRLRTDWGCVALLKRVARHVALAEGLTGGVLSIAIVGQRAMARLHQQFLGVAGATDVITFDLRGADEAGRNRPRRGSADLNAEIVVCADVARRRASPRTRRAQVAELALYVAHGVLHLAGYDDDDPRDFVRMHAREDELLGALGVGPVFAARR